MKFAVAPTIAVFAFFAISCATPMPGADQPASQPAPQPASQPASQQANSSTQPSLKEAKVYDKWPFDAKEAARRQEETVKATGLAKEISLVLDKDKKVKLKLVLMPAGRFLMGSPSNDQGPRDNEPEHWVTIARPFYMGTCSVTQGQWEAVMHSAPWKREYYEKPEGTRGTPGDWDYFRKGVNYPATCVCWDDAVEFCAKLSNLTGREFSLPTEEQREFACRAGTSTRFYCGDDRSYSALIPYAWWTDERHRYDHIHEVGLKKPNAWGLYDMHGNIFEWCADRYSEPHPPWYQIPPDGPPGLIDRTCRGGVGIGYSAGRGGVVAEERRGNMGFRVVMRVRE